MFRLHLLSILTVCIFLSVSGINGAADFVPQCLQFDDQYTNRTVIDLEIGVKTGGDTSAAIEAALEGSFTPPLILPSPDQQHTIIQYKTADAAITFGILPTYHVNQPLDVSGDANDGFWHDDVAWSPDSQWISYLTHRGDDGIYLSLVDAAGTIQHEQLISTRFEDSVSSFGWSADGHYLAISVSDSTGGPLRKIQIWSMPEMSLTTLIKLEDSQGGARFFGGEISIPDRIQWSPEGNVLAYLNHQVNGMTDSLSLNLYSPENDQTTSYELSSGANDYSTRMSWSPNGEAVAVISSLSTEEIVGRIELYGTDGRVMKNVSERVMHNVFLAGGGIGFPASFWSEDGQALLFIEQIATGSHNLGALMAYRPETMEKILVHPHIYLNPDMMDARRFLIARAPDDGEDHNTYLNTAAPTPTASATDSLVIVDTNTLEVSTLPALRQQPYMFQVYSRLLDESGWMLLSEDEMTTWAFNTDTGESFALAPSETGSVQPAQFYLPAGDSDVALVAQTADEAWNLSIVDLRDHSIQSIDYAFAERIRAVAVSPERDRVAVMSYATARGGMIEIVSVQGELIWQFDGMSFDIRNLVFTSCSE